MLQSQNSNDVYYRLQFDSCIPWRGGLRIGLLIAAIVADFFTVFSIIDCVVYSPLYAIGTVCLILLSVIMRYYSTKMIYSYKYLYNNGYFRIIKEYSMGQKSFINVNVADIENIRIYEKYDNRLSLLSTSNTQCAKYVITLKNKKQFAITPDEYMLALISRGYNGIL